MTDYDDGLFDSFVPSIYLLLFIRVAAKKKEMLLAWKPCSSHSRGVRAS